MSRPTLILFDRKKVYTVDSELNIPHERWKDLHKALQGYFLSDKKVQESYTAQGALRALGWDTRCHKKNIRRLVYNADNWNIKSMVSLNVIARFVDDGGFIYMVSEVTGSMWAIKFNNKRYTRERLLKKYIDLTSERDTKELLIESVQALFQLGHSKREIKSIIDELFVGHVLGR